MRLLICTLALLLIGGAATAQPLPLQPTPQPSLQPAPYVPTTQNQLRAYDYFLRTPSAYKTFSTGDPGYRIDTVTPFGASTIVSEPSYEHQRITPRGFERITVVPGYSGIDVSPGFRRQYYVPSYPIHTYMPSPYYRW